MRRTGKTGRQTARRITGNAFNPDLSDAPSDDAPICTDVLGSYTGTPLEGVAPVQDADDL